MRLLTAPEVLRRPNLLLEVGVPLLVTAFFSFTSFSEVGAVQAVAAFLLCWMPWAAYRKWLRGDRDKIPLFAFVASMFWLFYAVPFFWLRHEIGLVTGRHQLSEDAITKSLYLAVLGVGSLGLGTEVGGRSQLMKFLRLDIHRSPARWNYLRLSLLVTMVLRIIVPISALGGGGRQLLVIVETIVPSVSFVILLRYYMRGKAIPIDKMLVLGYSSLALIAGISSGWLGSFVGVAIMAAAVYVYEKRKLPHVAIMIGIPIVFFLQPGKDSFRQHYWHGESSDSYAERVIFWMDTSWTQWQRALSDSDGDKSKDLVNQTLGRLSLLQQTANVMEVTPEVVPYQYGRLYTYMLVTFIPRAFWPDKPSVNDSNRWYQVSYRLTAPNGLNEVSIAVGYLPESYINFGWFGPIVVMFCLGAFLGLFDILFLRQHSGLLLNSIGISLLPQLLSVEGQLAQYIAGFGQQIAIALIAMAPMFDLHRRTRAVISQPSFQRRRLGVE